MFKTNVEYEKARLLCGLTLADFDTTFMELCNVLEPDDEWLSIEVSLADADPSLSHEELKEVFRIHLLALGFHGNDVSCMIAGNGHSMAVTLWVGDHD